MLTQVDSLSSHRIKVAGVVLRAITGSVCVEMYQISPWFAVSSQTISVRLRYLTSPTEDIVFSETGCCFNGFAPETFDSKIVGVTRSSSSLSAAVPAPD